MNASPERLIVRPVPIAIGVVIVAAVFGFLVLRDVSVAVVVALVIALAAITIAFVVLHDRFEENWQLPEAILALVGWAFIVVLFAATLALWREVSGGFATGVVVITAIAVFSLGIWAHRRLRDNSLRWAEGTEGTLGSLGLGIVLAGVWLAVWLGGPHEDPSPLEPPATGPARLVAMGDSYMSGEGAQAFFPETNVYDNNECRRTSTAYAYRSARDLQLGLTFLACSGATTRDVRGSGQYGEGGQVDALDAVSLSEGSVVMISIGGNDSGFTEIALTCTAPSSCIEWADDWLDNVEERVRADVEETLRQIRARVEEQSDLVPVFAVTYPQIMNLSGCRWTWLTGEEHEFLGGAFTTTLNDAVRTAAKNAGVNVIEMVDAFTHDEQRMCDGDGPDDAATNFISASPVGGIFPFHPTKLPNVLHNSFHPKPAGHELMTEVAVNEIRQKRNRMASGETANPEPGATATEFPEAIDCEAEGADCPKALAPGNWAWLQVLGVVINVVAPSLLASLIGLFVIHWGLAPKD